MSSESKYKHILALFIIPIGGLVLLNLAFLLTAVIRFVFARFLISGSEEPARWVPLVIHLCTAIIFLFASYIILRSERLKDVYKAMVSVVPIAVLLVYTGMFLYNWPIAVYAVSVVIVAAILFYLYKTKRPWMYYYALFLISSALLYMQITGMDI